jgi:hypothetical protein
MAPAAILGDSNRDKNYQAIISYGTPRTSHSLPFASPQTMTGNNFAGTPESGFQILPLAGRMNRPSSSPTAVKFSLGCCLKTDTPNFVQSSLANLMTSSY